MEGLPIINKAYRVYHDGMINPGQMESFQSIDELPVVYADSKGKAKSGRHEAYDYEVDGQLATFLDLKCVRAKSYDKVLFQGQEHIRYKLEQDIRDKNSKEAKRMRIENLPDDAMFYVQNGFVGNSVLWWGKDSRGYVCDIRRAQKYTKEEVLKDFITSRCEDIIWESSHVESKISHHIDHQHLNQLVSISN